MTASTPPSAPDAPAADATGSSGGASGADEERFRLQLESEEGFRYRVCFDQDVPDLVVDEPEPLGEERGPNAARLVAAAVGHCLSASLLFCLRKSKVEGARVRATVDGVLSRNDRGRLRIGGLDVELRVEGVPEGQAGRLERCRELFEDYCVVTESIRSGIRVGVDVDSRPDADA